MHKRRDLEGPIHKAILDYLRWQFPKAAIHHSPNESDMPGADIARMKATAKGTVSGWPDLQILHNGKLYTIEVKAGKNAPSESQVDAGKKIVLAGGCWGVARSVEEAQALLRGWGAFDDPSAEAKDVILVQHNGPIR